MNQTQEFKETVKTLVAYVKIRQSFLNLYKIDQDTENLSKANSWSYSIEGLKREVNTLYKYGTHKNYLKVMGVEV